jgi:hypothetical protein
MNGDLDFKKKFWKELHFNILTKVNILKLFYLIVKTLNGHNSVDNGPRDLYDTAIDWRCNFIQYVADTRSLK